MNRREFLRTTALAAPAVSSIMLVPVFNAQGELAEILVVIVIVVVAITITVIIYRAAKKLLYPPPPPPPTNPPPGHAAPDSTGTTLPNATLRAEDSAPIYNVAANGWHMPDGSVCAAYAQVQLQGAPEQLGPWTDSLLVRVWFSGSQIIASWNDKVVAGSIEPPKGPSIRLDARADVDSSLKFFRTVGTG